MIALPVDPHGRSVRYLRLSVTDRCNLRCLYCAHALGLTFIPHPNILTYEEMLRLIGLAVPLGVDKVRLTGGEPFARKGFVGFLKTLRRDFPDLDVRITTNATLIAPHVPVLKDLGINALNISYDTFRRETFLRISGRDMYREAEAGLHAALASGIRVKINAVALKGVNDDELPAFFDLLRGHPVDVRFIEYMPLGGRGRWGENNFWSAPDILAAANAIEELIPLEKSNGARKHDGPARLFRIAGAEGRFGIISPLSNHFCTDCNRIRVTSDGRLRTCLFSDVEHPIRELLRDPAQGPDAVVALMAAALRDKPLGYKLLRERSRKDAVIRRSMSSIGG